MSFVDLLLLFATMAALAAVPSVSVMTVCARATGYGLAHGAWTALGIVAGDVIFVLLAVFGLGLLVQAAGDWFFLLRYIAGAYLIWLGITMWRARRGTIGGTDSASRRSSFATGLLITLADQKAILFYLGLLPAAVDTNTFGPADVAAVLAVTVASVGGVKLAYAYLASKGGEHLSAKYTRHLNIVAAILLVLAGLWVLAAD